MEQIQINKQNDQVLGELIAGRIERELKKKETFLQDLLDSIDTKIVYNLP